MALSINWNTGVITVPQADLTFVSAGLYQLNINTFRLWLRALEASADGEVYPNIHRHNSEVVLSGVTYARTFEILAPYTITFENLQYAVNLVGANGNIADVTNVNQVSIRSSNSAGLVSPGSGIAAAVWDEGRALTIGKFVALR